MRSSILFSLCLIVALALGASGLAFIAGRAAADPAGAYDRGVAAGERLGRQQARASLQRGDAQYDAILARGRKAGVALGRRRGRLTGVRAGRARGRDDAFGSFPGGWSVGRWYAVSITRGTDGARYAIGARALLGTDRWYGLCAGGRQLCQRGARLGAAGRRSSSDRTASP